MSLKEKINTYIHIEKELQSKNLELSQVKENIESKKAELQNIITELETKQDELESLKTEIAELKNFINSNFLNKFKNYDYKVDITNCYIIELNGKKYIAKKTIDYKTDTESYFYLYRTTISYHDYLHITSKNEIKFICSYWEGYIKGYNFYKEIPITGTKPSSEQHILEAYPELAIYSDNKVPNTHLKKIYYEANNLGSKKLIKSPLSIVPKPSK